MYIYSNDGQTQLAWHDALGETLKLVSDGVMSKASKEDPAQEYTYSGSGTFLGLATSPNATTPTYSAPSSSGWANGVTISNGTYYIVEEASVKKYLDKDGLTELVIKTKELVATKQNTLVSGTNIKTINNESLLGSGNITISGGGTATDVQIDSTSITSNNVANIKTINSNYNASTNKIATANDISTKMAKSNPTGTGSLAVGNNVRASGTNSVALGSSDDDDNLEASGNYSIATGYATVASGYCSHAEGAFTIASGAYSHAEGGGSAMIGKPQASGSFSHVEGTGTIAQRKSQHVFGEYNVADTAGTTTTRGDFIEIVGNGTDAGLRSNARTLDWSGNEILAGTSQATGFKIASGTSSQFLKADGSVDSTSYATTSALSTKLSTQPDGSHNLIDTNNKITITYLPDYILGQLVYGGTVTGAGVATLSTNAKSKLGTTSTSITLTNNTTAITGYAANEGLYYIVSSDGSFASLGLVTGDWLLSTGSAWKKIDNTDAVTGVKGNAETNYRTGAVNITPSNIGVSLTTTAGSESVTVGSNTLNFGSNAFNSTTIPIIPTTTTGGKVLSSTTTSGTVEWIDEISSSDVDTLWANTSAASSGGEPDGGSFWE